MTKCINEKQDKKQPTFSFLGIFTINVLPPITCYGIYFAKLKAFKVRKQFRGTPISLVTKKCERKKWQKAKNINQQLDRGTKTFKLYFSNENIYVYKVYKARSYTFSER